MTVRAVPPLALAIVLVVAGLPTVSAATLTEGYVGFDSGYTLALVQMATVGCDDDTNLGAVCFSLSVSAGRTLNAALRVRDVTGAAVPFGIVVWQGDGLGVSNLVLYCGDATIDQKAPPSGIVGVSVVIWGGHPAGALCPVLTGTGVAYVPGLPGSATLTY